MGSETVLSKWIKLYNANKELKDYIPKKEGYMAEARRKTTIVLITNQQKFLGNNKNRDVLDIQNNR